MISAEPANQATHQFTYPLELRVFVEGFRDPKQAIDDAIVASETILSSFLTESIRLGTDIRDVVPVSVNLEPLDASNDNSVILFLNFNFVLLNCY